MRDWRKLILSILFIFLAESFCIQSSAEVEPMHPSELAEKSDLIVIGSVTEIKTTDEKVKDRFGYDISVKYATISVEEVLKGDVVSTIAVQFVYNPDVEPDVQDPNLAEEKRVLLYLKDNNDPKNSYSVVDSWSGVARFYEGKFYHQYFEMDFEKYKNRLKGYIRQDQQTDYIPKNLEECYKALQIKLTKQELEEFKATKENELTKYHFGLGKWIRDNWQLWSKSELKNYFNKLGIFHPDDMSGIIITSFHRHLHNKDIKIEEQIKDYHNFWKESAIKKANAYIQEEYKGDSFAHAKEDNYLVIEGKGIQDVAMLNGNIQSVIKTWGEADYAKKDDFPYSPYVFYEYHKRGASFTTDNTGKILGITLYCNTGKKEKFHKTGLIWINPSSIYQTFQGLTSKGLKFKDKMVPEDVYSVYGKTETMIEAGNNVQSKLKEGRPLIVDMKKAGFTIWYPESGISFTVFDGMVESCNVELSAEQSR